ncbi:DSBA-like thioredoxin protein [Rhizobium sp. N6212]|nr:DSBA-like thioredoxin protein [Rhizobium sp. N6212]ANK97525.1 DSBA-like thioredoxin protein [Rhizobium sp. N621]ANL03645.1 DSBA-like thioredoxin protein [Rhizobium esperanzae]ANL09691.1 DSBA-like thioredoxin protein [Rhizobium sp. N1341]ANM34494.1 DSBA-like thioredoxin protein [Rhizobium sp. N871]ANM40532.1 DSBA-like thioredoxin protein [Rhizobium sp. N741]
MLSMKTARMGFGIAAIAVAMALFPINSRGADLLEPIGRMDHPIGSASAPVTIIEYSSPTCPHCVDYRTQVAPEIEKEFIERGKARLIFRPFVRNNVDMAIFMLCEWQEGSKYQELTKLFYSKYDEIAQTGDIEKELRDIAASAGIDKPTFDRLVSDQSILDGLSKLTSQARDDFKVEGTPTFFVNGKKFTGAQSAEEMRANIEKASKPH